MSSRIYRKVASQHTPLARKTYFGFRPDAPKNRNRPCIEYRDASMRPISYVRHMEAVAARPKAVSAVPSRTMSGRQRVRARKAAQRAYAASSRIVHSEGVE